MASSKLTPDLRMPSAAFAASAGDPAAQNFSKAASRGETAWAQAADVSNTMAAESREVMGSVYDVRRAKWMERSPCGVGVVSRVFRKEERRAWTRFMLILFDNGTPAPLRGNGQAPRG